MRDGENVVLHLNPREPSVMLIACLHAQWSGPKTGEQLLSFAAVTDDRPEEVAAAGHDPLLMLPFRLSRHICGWTPPQPILNGTARRMESHDE